MKIVLVLLCFGLVVGCGYGLIATFEPMDSGEQLMWRVIYGIGTVLGLGGAVWALRQQED